jgi:hypothetical protein
VYSDNRDGQNTDTLSERHCMILQCNMSNDEHNHLVHKMWIIMSIIRLIYIIEYIQSRIENLHTKSNTEPPVGLV